MVKVNKRAVAVVVLALAIGVAFGLLSGKKPAGAPSANDKDGNPVVTDGQNNNNDDNDSTPTANITVTEPVANQAVGDKFRIRGQARVFENNVSIRLSNATTKTVYLEAFTTATGEMGQFSSYEYNVDISSKTTKPKTGDSLKLEVFEHSAKDGSEINKVTVPLKYVSAAETMSLKVFFSKSSNADFNCDLVYASNRSVTKTIETAKAALTELLKGPTTAEAQAGYVTNIGTGTKLLSVAISGGVATANFDGNLEKGADSSCKVLGIREQITQTLKQFPTVTSVVIQSNGDANILQP